MNTLSGVRSVISNIYLGILSILGLHSKNIPVTKHTQRIETPSVKLISKPKRTRCSTGKSFYQFDGEQYPINTHGGKYSCEEYILNSGIFQLLVMLSFHSRVLSIRVDLHLTEYEPTNERISKLTRKFVKKFKREYSMKRIAYQWVREQERAKSQHYHLVFYLDGNKIRHPAKVNEWIREYWQGQNQPKPPIIGRCYSMVKRGDKSSIDEAVYRMSYMAKSRGKGYRDHYTKDYSSSRLSPLTA